MQYMQQHYVLHGKKFKIQLALLLKIVKVKTLQGRAKLMAEIKGLSPNDLVILTINMEKIIGDPVSYLLSQVELGGE